MAAILIFWALLALGVFWSPALVAALVAFVVVIFAVGSDRGTEGPGSSVDPDW